MAELRTEEEQIAAIKDWWKENGNSILVAIGLALAIGFGWKAYQNSVIETKSEASMLYEQMLSASSSPVAQNSDESTGVSYLANQLKEQHASTEYARYAALFLAKEAVAAKEYDAAIAELDWLIAGTEDARLIDIATVRKARVLSAKGEHEAALALLEPNEAEFEAEFLELQGDIKLRMGDESAAVDAYKKAYALLEEQTQLQPLLGIKLANLGVDTQQL